MSHPDATAGATVPTSAPVVALPTDDGQPLEDWEVQCLPGNARLYWLHDWTGRLLYVGVSSDFAARWKVHQATSDWSHFIAQKHLAAEVAEGVARAAERRWIRELRPVFNRLCNPDFEELGKTARTVEYKRRLREVQAEFNARVNEVLAPHLAEWFRPAA